MKKRSYSFLAFLLLFFAGSGYAQKDTEGKSDAEILDEAEFFFGDGNYIRAIPIFQTLAGKNPNDALYRFRLGICYIYKNDEKEKAIQYLDQVYQTDPQTKDLLYYLGVAYHLNYKFDEATKYFNDYLATNPPVNKKVLVNKYIENCRNGKVMIQTKFKSDIKNLGTIINSKYSEYVPVISSDESVLIFTYRGSRSKGGLMDEELKPASDGEYYEDIFISQKVGREWLIPESIGDNINSNGHDASVALSADGQKLFIFRSTPKDHGDLYMSQLDGEVWTTPQRLGPTINTKYWEGSASLSSDEQILYFASERPGGLGKRDIWMAHKLENGEWGEAVNLGPNVNTPLNDDAPFIHPDGVTLFFSSEGHNSMGGYDIMYSILENNEWSRPTNLDYPVNTTGDDTFYVLSADGETGYFSSERKDGLGQQDIYVVSPGIQGEKPVLALIVGTTSANSKPVDAGINVFITGTDKKVGSYASNSSTGKYIFSLQPGNQYKIVVGYPGMDSITENVDLRELIRYIKIQKDFKLLPPQVKTDSSRKDSADLALQVEEIKKKDRLFEKKTYQSVLKTHGEEVTDSVDYVIELGRYADTTLFNPSKITGMGNIYSRKTDDGITTFSMGPFKTLLDVEIFKYKLLSTDSSFAETSAIVVNDHGKRTLIAGYFSSEYKQNRFDPVEEKPVVIKTEPVKDTTLVALAPSPLPKDTTTVAVVPAPVPKDTTPVVVMREPEVKEQPAPEPVLLKNPLMKRKKPGVKIISERKIEPRLESEEDLAINEIYSVMETKALRAHYENLRRYDDRKIRNYGSKYDTENPFVSLLDEIDAYEKGFKISERSDHRPAVPSLPPSAISHFERPQPIFTRITPVSSKRRSIVLETEQMEITEHALSAPVVLITIPCETNPMLDCSAFIGKDLNDTIHYNKLIRLAGKTCVEGLSFRVQIAAYRHPENYKYKYKVVFGPVDAKAFPDGITRFTVKEFQNLVEAEAFRKEVIKRGVKDAMVSGVYNGERKLLQDLIAVNFYNRSVN